MTPTNGRPILRGKGASQNVPSLKILGANSFYPTLRLGPKHRQRGHSSEAH
jgi:hypothetical protein